MAANRFVSPGVLMACRPARRGREETRGERRTIEIEGRLRQSSGTERVVRFLSVTCLVITSRSSRRDESRVNGREINICTAPASHDRRTPGLSKDLTAAPRNLLAESHKPHARQWNFRQRNCYARVRTRLPFAFAGR